MHKFRWLARQGCVKKMDLMINSCVVGCGVFIFHVASICQISINIIGLTQIYVAAL